ncbi:PAS domain-containing sensor histidine kinase [Mucilaginibacter sp.]|uniref:PAS domain-containing sensor histidine kinase n=1 Tax=Mucilaginibacter sp. TaxID=1882438 RepID=UPI003D11C408
MMPRNDLTKNKAIQFLNGGGEMGELTRYFDWAGHTLGPPETWPQSLKTTLSIILNSRFPMFLFWGQDSICFYNDAYRPSLGNNGKHPAIGQPGAVIWPEIWTTISPLIEQVMNGGEASWNEDLLLPIYRNGNVEDVYWTFSYSPVKDETGQPAGVFVTCTETTEKVKVIAKLRQSDQRFQNLVREATVGIIVLIGPEMNVGIVNEGYARLIGRRVDELIDHPLFEIIPETEAVFRPIIEQVRVSGEPLHLYAQPYFIAHAEGAINGFLNLVYQPYKEADGEITGVMVLCQEVTELVNAKLNTEEAEERARLAVEAAALGTFDLNLQTDALITSPRLDEIMGIDPSSNHTTYFSAIHPDDLMIRHRALETAFETGKLHYIVRIIKEGDIRWIQTEGKVYYDKEGKPLRLLGSMLDITDKKLDDLRKNDFIAMVSHELKTPLTSLQAYIQVLNGKAQKSEDSFEKNLLGKADLQVRKMGNMINGFLNLSRLESGKLPLAKTQFDLDELLSQIIDNINTTINSHEIRFEPCPPVTVFADQEKIGSVLTNLLHNAIKYSPKGKLVEVKCELLENGAQVSVKDEGMGIKPADLPYLFDRYYRVESKHTAHISGFGIGLYLSAEIVNQHNGKIWAESEIGIGSTFYFSLPL